MLLTDDAFSNADVYVAGYETPPHGGNLTVDEVVSSLANRFEADGVFTEHQEVIFVAHSLGGIVVQSFLVTFPKLAQQVKLIFFVAAPETGSEVATYAKLFNADPLIKELKSGAGNDYLLNLENKWRAAAAINPIKTDCAYETKKIHHVLVVDRLSATRMCPVGVPLPVSRDHIEIVKPCSPDDDVYLRLRNDTKALAAPRTEAPAIPGVLPPVFIGPVKQGGDGNCQANAVGGNATVENCGTPDPYKPTVTYSPEGFKYIKDANNFNVVGPNSDLFADIRAMEDGKDWVGLLDWSEKQKKDMPGWFTPDLTSGDALVHLCQPERARLALNTFMKETFDAIDYQSLRNYAKVRLTSLDSKEYKMACHPHS